MNYLSATNCATSPGMPLDPPSQVSQKQDQLDQRVRQLQEMMSQLETRLSPVLHPATPKPATENEKTVEIMVEVAQRTHNSGREVDLVISHLSDILNRLAI